MATVDGLTLAVQGLCDFNCKFGNCLDACVTDEISDDDDLDDIWEPDTDPMPSCDGQYTTFEQLDAESNSFEDNCKYRYTLQVLGAVLSDALSRYDAMLKDGYDDNVYSKAVVSTASKSVSDFYHQQGNDYFTCVMTEMQVCCDYCKSHYDDDRCGYCFDDTCYSSKKRPRGGCCRSRSGSAGGSPRRGETSSPARWSTS